MRWSSFLYHLSSICLKNQLGDQGIDADKTDLDRKGPDETPGP
jgi:hypothetical protein